MFDKIKCFFQRFFHFLSVGIWKVNTNGEGSLKNRFYNIIKSFILAYRNFDFTKLSSLASSLTYNSILSIVPLLAVLFAIARGFGLQNLVENELFSYFSGQKALLQRAMSFIDKSLEYAQGGVFLGIGIILLLYTVINLISCVEDDFNLVWGIKKGRSYLRQFTDYLALILITPVFIICNAGLSIVLNSTLEKDYIGLVMTPFAKVLPFVITIFLFTLLYVCIPNTKVKFSSGLFAGIVSGTIFQIFQMLYIGGQIWISKYNAIYGSFAAIPLLLLWLQLSWFIILIGVELSFSYQNVSKFSFERKTDNVSQRYKNFILMMLTSLIVKRFETEGKPYTANELSETYKIPTRLTSNTLYFLLEIGIIVETPSGQDSIPAYTPAIDINKISISYLFLKATTYGSENFEIDTENTFAKEWDIIAGIEGLIDEKNKNVLLKDI